ncbi:ribokinase [Aquisalibacillus elongatus]|uniref:Deoxyribokinase n=1 Tax=Aquisalibacillus elongatus TaxID=485577 RepID=A0A3N5CBL3_9BACI|nr:ribokinase [Aquisalibacillus elongatus]RPF54241.1 ribokinase [Aquisalibacillus elongatus]
MNNLEGGSEVLVIGSFMMDLVFKSSRAPKDGETVIGESFKRYPGGKGANQAVAAQQLGASVTMAGKLGADLYGEEILKVLHQKQINTGKIIIDSNETTGVASINVDAKGNNRITIVPGANHAFTENDLLKIKNMLFKHKVLVLQMELNLNVTFKAVELAHEVGIPVILNPAPAAIIPEKVLSKITYLTPNESEVELLTGLKIFDIEDAYQAGEILINKGVKNVIITLGSKGAVIVNEELKEFVPGFKVKAIDTVAAGDTFNGALAMKISKEIELEKCVQFANASAALSVTKDGAIPSIPTESEVQNFLLKYQN